MTIFAYKIFLLIEEVKNYQLSTFLADTDLIIFVLSLNKVL